MREVALDPARCPVCGVRNECGLVEGRGDCWCGRVEVAADVLEALSTSGLGGVACLCRACLSGEVPSPCVRMCEVDAKGEACVACSRTLDEIRRWSRGSAGERAAILLDLRRRQAADAEAEVEHAPTVQGVAGRGR